MSIRSVALILAAVLASSVAVGQARAQRSDSTHSYSFTPPASVAGFRMTGREILTPAGAGARVRYQRPGAADWIDVYVYPTTRDSACTAGCDTVAVHRESNDFAGMIPELLRRGYYDSLRVATDRRVEMPTAAGPVQARHLVLRGGREGRAVASQFYLVPGGEVLVKVRATYAPDPTQDAAVDEFARGFVAAALQTANACSGGAPEDRGLTMKLRFAQPLAQLRPRVPAALQKLGYVLDPVPSEDAWVTRPVREWPARDDWARVRTFTHPGVQVMVEARADGAKTELSISARVLCGLPAQRDIETATVLIAAMEVVMQFPDREEP